MKTQKLKVKMMNVPMAKVTPPKPEKRDKPAKAPAGMAALFGQKRSRPAVQSVPIRTPSF